ncbi:MAG: Fe-S cluster assembly sulfur transfer protein SufU [Planctomycetota bacterium]
MTGSSGSQADNVHGARTHHEEQGLDQLYRDVIFEHYRRPHNKGVIEGAQIVTKGNNPVCGDRVTVYGKLAADGKLERVTFDGKGCAICIASCSLMTEAVKGKTLDDAGQASDHFKAMMRNEAPFEVPEEVPDLEALEGVRKFSVRVKCATLPWTTLKNGILEYQAGKSGPASTEESCATNEAEH